MKILATEIQHTGTVDLSSNELKIEKNNKDSHTEKFNILATKFQTLVISKYQSIWNTINNTSNIEIQHTASVDLNNNKFERRKYRLQY